MRVSRQEYWNGQPSPPPGESSRPRDRTRISCISCIGRGVFYHHLGSSFTEGNPFKCQPHCLLAPGWGCRGSRFLWEAEGSEAQRGQGDTARNKWRGDWHPQASLGPPSPTPSVFCPFLQAQMGRSHLTWLSHLSMSIT